MTYETADSEGMMDEELGRCQIAKGVMGTDVIVDVFPMLLHGSKRLEIEVAEIGMLELFGMSQVSSFHGAVVPLTIQALRNALQATET